MNRSSIIIHRSDPEMVEVGDNDCVFSVTVTLRGEYLKWPYWNSVVEDSKNTAVFLDWECLTPYEVGKIVEEFMRQELPVAHKTASLDRPEEDEEDFEEDLPEGLDNGDF